MATNKGILGYTSAGIPIVLVAARPKISSDVVEDVKSLFFSLLSTQLKEYVRRLGFGGYSRMTMSWLNN